MSRRTEAGFTLLETLVALVILGLIVAGLSRGLRFGLTAWDHQAASIDRDGALDTTDRTLRTLLSGMLPSADPQVATIVGSGGRLAFTTTLPATAPGTPTRLADVALGWSPPGSLVLRWLPHLHARLLVRPEPRQDVLVPGLSGVTFAYYHPASGGQAAGWAESWNGADAPALVRVHLAFRDPARHWPDVIVAPMRHRDDE